MGGQRRFVKKIPPSGAAPTFKLSLPHHDVHRYMLHLVDDDLELAGSPDAEQTWHASVVLRRNKERSEFTLQGWRLFAEAHRIQAGDQVAFELVTETRLVAQVIKHADCTQLPQSPKAKGFERQAGTSPHAPRSIFQRLKARAGDHTKALDEVPLPTEDEWDILPEALSSAAGTCQSPDARSCITPQTKPHMVSDWASEGRAAGPSMGMELDYFDTRHSLGSTSGSVSRSMLSRPPAAVTYPSCLGTPSTPPSPLTYAPHPDRLEDSLHNIFMGDDESLMLEDMFGGDAPSRQPFVAPLGGVHTSTPSSPVAIQNTMSSQMDNDSQLVQSLQMQAHEAQSQAEAARQRCECLRRNMQGLQSSLKSHSRKALRATVGLEACSANLSYTNTVTHCTLMESYPWIYRPTPRCMEPAMENYLEHFCSVPADMTPWLSQLKDSLSQLFIIAIDDDCSAADPPPVSTAPGGQSTTFNQFTMPP